MNQREKGKETGEGKQKKDSNNVNITTTRTTTKRISSIGRDKRSINLTIPGITSPMHGIDFGQVTSQSTSRTHLYSTDGFQAGRRLFQVRVACSFSCILRKRRKKKKEKNREKNY